MGRYLFFSVGVKHVTESTISIIMPHSLKQNAFQTNCERFLCVTQLKKISDLHPLFFPNICDTWNQV